MDPGTEDLRIIPTDVESPANGCIFVGIKGSYVSEVDKALDKINHIRLEACQEGFLNPRTNQPLTEADYVPIKWSYDLEYIARIRAAESALTSQHMRTNGDNCFALKSPNGIGSYGEVLAWNWSSYMTNGIDQWYGEKTDWVNQTEGAVTGHYTQMIDPKNLYVGLGTFCNYYTHYYNTTAGEFSSFRNMDESRMGMTGKCIQLVEVNKNYLNNISYIEGEKNGETGSDTSLSLITGVAYQYSSYLPIMSAVSWCSTKESVATVSDKGVVHAKTAGETIIQAAVDGIKMAEVTFKVTQNSNPDSYQTSIENASIDGILDKKYTGNEIEQTSLKVILDGVELTPGEDYEIYYSNNINVGTANITIQGIGNYTGTVERTFEILEIFQSTIAVDSGSCGDNAVWTYYSDGTVRISGTGSIRAVVQDDGSCNWIRYYTIDEEQEALGYVKVHTVFIEEGITSIEQRTFTEDSETDSPESIIMADSVTAIGDRAFYNCKNLNYIWIGSGLETVGSFVFSYCPNLKQILVSEENPYFASVDGALYSKSFQTLYRVPHSGIEYLQIPDGVTTLSMDSVGDLEELKVVEFPLLLLGLKYMHLMDAITWVR